MCQDQVTTDRHMNECFGTNEFYCMEQVQEDLVNDGGPVANLLLHLWIEVKFSEGSNFKTSVELQIAICFSKMCDTDQAQDSNLEDSVACIFTHKYVHSEGRYASFHLDVKPDQVLPVQEHQRYKLLVDVLWKRFEG